MLVAGTLAAAAADHLAPGLWPFSVARLERGVQTALLALCAIGVVAIGVRTTDRRSARQWRLLAALFALLVALKTTGSFGRFVHALRALDRGGTVLGWQPSSAILVAVEVVIGAALALFFFTWVRALIPEVRRRVVAGGVTFLAGAVGAEALTEWLWAVVGPTHPYYVAADTLETALELTGLLIFFDGVLYQLGALHREGRVSATGRPRDNTTYVN